jgi:hypothetical protein
MRSPFRYQATDYDCVPTTLINALQYLFEREEIPPEVIQKVMQYTLDTMNSRGEPGMHGPTEKAIDMILQWLGIYSGAQRNNFRVLCEYCHRDEVHLRQNNKIVSCLNRGGAALLNVCYDDRASIFHYLLAISSDEEYIYCFDPLYRRRNFTDKAIKWLGATQSDVQAPNLRIERKRLDTLGHKKYSMGFQRERECCLIERM